jgi:hypothetical protein
VRGSSSSLKKTAVSPAMTTGRPPVSTTTTCEPGVCPGAGTSRSPRQQLELAVHGDVLHAGAWEGRSSRRPRRCGTTSAGTVRFVFVMPRSAIAQESPFLEIADMSRLGCFRCPRIVRALV